MWGQQQIRPQKHSCYANTPLFSKAKQGTHLPHARNSALQASSTQSATATRPLHRARTVGDLKDPAHIGATHRASTRVMDYGGDVSLSTYMTLPVEQYFVLDPSQIQFLGGNRFLLTVPRINVLGVWLEPMVEVSVIMQAQPSRVVLQAENCRIHGSGLIENLRLDERFCLRFVTELTWSSSPPPAAAAVAVPAAAAAEAAVGSSDALSSGSGGGGISWGGWGAKVVAPANGNGGAGNAAPLPQGEISASAQLDVWSEVIPPFHLMPRSALESSCNVVMRSLVGSLLPLFVRKLAADYQKWAQLPEYRAQRAARSKPLS